MKNGEGGGRGKWMAQVTFAQRTISKNYFFLLEEGIRLRTQICLFGHFFLSSVKAQRQKIPLAVRTKAVRPT